MSPSSDILNGLDEIREFWDPHMSEFYFRKYILPELKYAQILFERKYRGRNIHKLNIPFYYTYKDLLLTLKLRLHAQDKAKDVSKI